MTCLAIWLRKVIVFSKIIPQGSHLYRYFSYDFKNATSLGKMYLLPKIHKRLQDVLGRPVISNCGTPTEKVSEFLDYYLKPVMQAGKSCVKDTGDFLQKLRNLGGVPDNAILVSADVVALYPSIPYEDGLKSLFERYKRERLNRYHLNIW